MTKLMLDAEKKYRKLYAAHYEFSPQVKCWLDRCHAYKNLIKLERKRIELDLSCATKVKTMNVGNIKRTAWRNGIRNPLDLSLGSCSSGQKNARSTARDSWWRLLG